MQHYNQLNFADSLNNIKHILHIKANEDGYLNKDQIIENTTKFNNNSKLNESIFPIDNLLGLQEEVNQEDQSLFASLMSIAKKKDYINLASQTYSNVNSAYILLDKKYIALYTAFLDYKSQFGNSYEKKIYCGMTIDQFITRLLKATPLSYSYIEGVESMILRNGQIIYISNVDSQDYDYEHIFKMILEKSDDYNNLEEVYQDYLTNHEIELSGLLNIVSDITIVNKDYLIDIGNPENYKTNKNDYVFYTTSAPIIGCNRFLDNKYCVVNDQQNLYKNGFGYHFTNIKNDFLDNKILASFWQDDLYPTVGDVDGKYLDIKINDKSLYLNHKIYTAKLNNMIQNAFMEAINIANDRKRNIEINILPISFENMKYDISTNKELIELFMICWLNNYNHLSEVDKDKFEIINFSYFEELLCHNFSIQNRNELKEGIDSYQFINIGKKIYKNIELFVRQYAQEIGIAPYKIIFNNDILKLHNKNCVKFITYSKHPNAFVGNNFWDHDHAKENIFEKIAIASNIGQVQNPYINTKLNGNNCFIIDKNGSKIKLNDYINHNFTGILHDVNNIYQKYQNYISQYSFDILKILQHSLNYAKNFYRNSSR